MAAVGAVSARTETGSFLDVPARNVSSLLHQIQSRPAVLNRYTRHFGSTRQALLARFGVLKLVRLSKAGAYGVYSEHDDGVIRRKKLWLRKGTYVFVDKSGRPVLKQSCGNPLTPGTDVSKNPVSKPGVSNLVEVLRPFGGESQEADPDLQGLEPIVQAESRAEAFAPLSALTGDANTMEEDIPSSDELTSVLSSAPSIPSFEAVDGTPGLLGGLLIDGLMFLTDHSSSPEKSHSSSVLPAPAAPMIYGIFIAGSRLRRRRALTAKTPVQPAQG